MDLVRAWSPWIVIGTIAGAIVAGRASTQVLYALFRSFLLVVAVRMAIRVFA